MRLTIQTEGGDAAKPLVRFKDKAFQRRGDFELRLAELAKDITAEAAATVIADMPPEEQTLAWLAYARAHARRHGTLPRIDNADTSFLVEVVQPVEKAPPAVAAK